MKERVRKYKKSDIVLSKHVLIRCAQRKINPNMIFDLIQNPEKLTGFEQEFLSRRESKYKLIFQLSNARDLAVVIVLNGRLEVITAWFVIKKWERRMRKYDKV